MKNQNELYTQIWSLPIYLVLDYPFIIKVLKDLQKTKLIKKSERNNETVIKRDIERHKISS